jgi:hypothetical protein
VWWFSVCVEAIHCARREDLKSEIRTEIRPSPPTNTPPHHLYSPLPTTNQAYQAYQASTGPVLDFALLIHKPHLLMLGLLAWVYGGGMLVLVKHCLLVDKSVMYPRPVARYGPELNGTGPIFICCAVLSV